jgi:hypothetical protein
MATSKKVTVEFTVTEAEALWTAANNGRNDFLYDPHSAKFYFARHRGIGNASRAMDKLAKTLYGKVDFAKAKRFTDSLFEKEGV